MRERGLGSVHRHVSSELQNGDGFQRYVAFFARGGRTTGLSAAGAGGQNNMQSNKSLLERQHAAAQEPPQLQDSSVLRACVRSPGESASAARHKIIEFIL
jgi:hypothetical protein